MNGFGSIGRGLGWCLACSIALGGTSHAATFTLNQTSGGYTYKAQADFTYVGSILTVVLTNTQTSNAVAAANGQALTGLFWNLNVPVGAATASAGSSTFGNGNGGSYTPTNTPGQHWAYKAGAPSFGGGTNFGVGAAGFNHFGNHNAFEPGGSKPVLNGVDWGLLGGNWNIGGNQKPFIISSMTFTFDVGSSFNLNSITNVWFQYGSGFNEFRGGGLTSGGGNSNPVPEPASLAMIGFVSAGVAAARRKKARSSA